MKAQARHILVKTADEAEKLKQRIRQFFYRTAQYPYEPLGLFKLFILISVLPHNSGLCACETIGSGAAVAYSNILSFGVPT